MRRTLLALIACVPALVLIGVALIASGREQSPRAGAVLAANAAAATGVPTPESVPQASGDVLAEMTRVQGTPRQVTRAARLRARTAARQLARIRARDRAAAAAAARQRAATRGRTSGGSSAGAGDWRDPAASSVNSSFPTSAAENAWLQGGYGGWIEPNGMARAPANAPDAIKRAIAAGNRIARAPYLWGGGHGKWEDSGYDCSGSVSYALAYGGMLGTTLTSGQMAGWGSPGPGKWLTVYANEGHVFMYVAGLRFDTSGRSSDRSSRWQLAPRSAAGFVARHYPGL